MQTKLYFVNPQIENVTCSSFINEQLYIYSSLDMQADRHTNRIYLAYAYAMHINMYASICERTSKNYELDTICFFFIEPFFNIKRRCIPILEQIN